MAYALTPDAIELGLNAALPAEFEFTERDFGRGERTSARTYQLTYLIDTGDADPVTLVRSA